MIDHLKKTYVAQKPLKISRTRQEGKQESRGPGPKVAKPKKPKKPKTGKTKKAKTKKAKTAGKKVRTRPKKKPKE